MYRLQIFNNTHGRFNSRRHLIKRAARQLGLSMPTMASWDREQLAGGSASNARVFGS